MTTDKITLRDALARLREVHDAERERVLDAADEIFRVMAEAAGSTVDEMRVRMKPHLDRQLETIDELHRLAVADLTVLAEEERP